MEEELDISLGIENFVIRAQIDLNSHTNSHRLLHIQFECKTATLWLIIRTFCQKITNFKSLFFVFNIDLNKMPVLLESGKILTLSLSSTFLS